MGRPCFLAAAAVIVVVASPVIAAAIATAVAIAAEGGAAATAAVAEQQDQNDDPPPVVIQAATETIVITAHKSTSRKFLGVFIPCSMVFPLGIFVQEKPARRKLWGSSKLTLPEQLGILLQRTIPGGRIYENTDLRRSGD